ncbi:hypothetical protein BDZ89DRAFT_1157449 [Hymenopellis radicata]|nr:hypothetical protein BDZ89DRAFT_1157449 [Hymenopellis radicata]
MADFTLVEPTGWTLSLHSIYSAYIGYFQVHNIAWYDRSWGHLFASFPSFLSFSWPVITLTDAETGKAHIVTRPGSLNAFVKMVKTRFGETLPMPPNILSVTPFSNAQRHMRHVSDWSTYKKLHATLPAAELSAVKTRIRAGDPSAILPLWRERSKTFLALSFAWSERNEKSCLEWGYAAVRCGVLHAQGQWPPVPDINYRVGHYVTSEYSSKTVNRVNPTYPWAYAFGDTQIIGKSKISQVVEAVITSLASPESETSSNKLVLVTYGGSTNLITRLEEMGVRMPPNVLILDGTAYERQLFTDGRRGVMPSRQPGSSMTMDNIIRSLLGVVGGIGGPIPIGGGMVTPHNSGNEAFLGLLTLQMLVEPETVQIPDLKNSPKSQMNMMSAMTMPMSMPMGMDMMMQGSMGRHSMPPLDPQMMDEFGQMRLNGGSGTGSRGGRQLEVEGSGSRMRKLSGNIPGR